MTKTIAIDYTPAYEQGGGIGRLVRDSVDALGQLNLDYRCRLFVSGYKSDKLLPPVAGNFVWRTTRIPPRWLARLWHRAQIRIPVETFVGYVDLYHATDFVLPPTFPKTQTIVTVHDLSFVRVPEAASPRLKRYLDRVVPHSVRRADCVIADSEATRQDIIELYGVSSDKVVTLLSGVRQHVDRDSLVLSLTMRNKYRFPERPYLFSLGTVQPRKNYSRVIRSLKHLRDAGYDLDLVIAGGRGWLEDDIHTTIQKMHLQDHVHLIGFADDADLPALYANAEVVVFPSLYEGFGFPVLEGMVYGTPVVTSNLSSLPEVAGDAALLVDPYDVDAITAAIRQILEDTNLRQTLIERGHHQVRQFTWERTARQLNEIYERVLAMK